MIKGKESFWTVWLLPEDLYSLLKHEHLLHTRHDVRPQETEQTWLSLCPEEFGTYRAKRGQKSLPETNAMKGRGRENNGNMEEGESRGQCIFRNYFWIRRLGFGVWPGGVAEKEDQLSKCLSLRSAQTNLRTSCKRLYLSSCVKKPKVMV